jgi:hypothetical protein
MQWFSVTLETLIATVSHFQKNLAIAGTTNSRQQDCQVKLQDKLVAQIHVQAAGQSCIVPTLDSEQQVYKYSRQHQSNP